MHVAVLVALVSLGLKKDRFGSHDHVCRGRRGVNSDLQGVWDCPHESRHLQRASNELGD